MYLQNSNNTLMPMELNQQLTSPFFARFPIPLQRKLDKRMNSNAAEWFFQSPILPGVSAKLVNRKLWQQFYDQNTEMIITKSGRRMFPSIQINVNGLQKRENYYVLLEILPASNFRHKYCGCESGSKSGSTGGWSTAGSAEPQHPLNRRIYMHPDSPAVGNHWMDNSINFNKLKLTNNMNDNTNIILTSMHKYVCKIWVIQCSNAKNYNELFSYPATSFVFEETEFIAVTAYQNQNITKLKIDNNPFAKGFRETGQSRYKRKYYQIDRPIQSDTSRDTHEGGSVSFSDTESNQVASGRGSVTSHSENSMPESAEKLVVENNTDTRDDARLVNSRSSVETEREVPFHRPWLDPPRNQVTPLPHNIQMPYYFSDLSYYHHIYSYYMASQNYMRFHDYYFRDYRPL